MVKAGYAWAGSTFRQGGVAVRDAAEDTERLRGIFEAAVDAIITADNSLILRETMKDLEKRLDPRKFQRVHRSTIVNLSAIASVLRDEMGRQRITHMTDHIVVVGLGCEITKLGDILDDAILSARPQDRTFPLRLFFGELSRKTRRLVDGLGAAAQAAGNSGFSDRKP